MAPRQAKRKSSDAELDPLSDEGMVLLHRASFVEWKPAPIVGVASSEDGSLAAIVRESGDVELYETSSMHQFQVCYKTSVSHLVAFIHACIAMAQTNTRLLTVFSHVLGPSVREKKEKRTSTASPPPSLLLPYFFLLIPFIPFAVHSFYFLSTIFYIIYCIHPDDPFSHAETCPHHIYGVQPAMQRIPGHVEASPTSIAVVDGNANSCSRILVGGLDGTIYEIDYEAGKRVAVSDSYGGAVWALAVEPSGKRRGSGIKSKSSDNLRSEENHQGNKQREGRVPNVGMDGHSGMDQRSNESESSDDDDADAAQRSNDGAQDGLKKAIAENISGKDRDPYIAVACDDGCVRLFSVNSSSSGISYVKSLPRVEGRCLTASWHPAGDVIVSAGTDGCIHAWNVHNGHEILRITAGDSSGKEICIWSTMVLPNGTIVSGDSGGGVAFWDATSGTLLRRFSQHDGDVLQLACSPDGWTVFAAGIDPRIAVFHGIESTSVNPLPQHGGGIQAPNLNVSVKKSGSSSIEWVFLSAKRPHTHDVRALCITGNDILNAKLLSGGNDTVLKVHSVKRFLKEHPKTVDPCPQKPVICASSRMNRNISISAKSPGSVQQQEDEHEVENSNDGAILVAAIESRINVWQLMGTSNARRGIRGASSGMNHPLSTHAKAPQDRLPQEGDRPVLESIPVHVAQLVNGNGYMIVAAAISEDGRFLVYSDMHKLRCFEVAADVVYSARSSICIKNKTLSDGRSVLKPIKLDENVSSVVKIEFLTTKNPQRSGKTMCELVVVTIDGTIRLLEFEEKPVEEETGDGQEDTGRISIASHAIRSIHDLKYKMWMKRDRSKSTARWLMPTIDPRLLAFSPCKHMLAAVVHGRIYVVSLKPQTSTLQIPMAANDASIITAIGFTPDGEVLVVALSGETRLLAFDVPSGSPTSWLQKNAKEVEQRLSSLLPGPVDDIISSPVSPKGLFLKSDHAVCCLDLDASLPSSLDGQQGVRRRDRAKMPRLLTAADSSHGGMNRSTPPGQNCRALYSRNPILSVQPINEGDVVIVERPWSDVHRLLPPPLYRHRYGT